jgi:hypothetical protein
MQQTPRDWFITFCFMLSFFAMRSLLRRQRGKVPYWLVIICCAGWFALAVTSNASSGSLQFGPWQITDPVLSGRIFGGTLTGLVLVLYAFNRKNRRWHGLS